jgi:hypothetical protein
VVNSVVVSVDVIGGGGTPSSVMVIGGGGMPSSVIVTAGGGTPGSVIVTYSVPVSVQVAEQLDDEGRAPELRGRVVVVTVLMSFVVTEIELVGKDGVGKDWIEAVPVIVCVSEIC